MEGFVYIVDHQEGEKTHFYDIQFNQIDGIFTSYNNAEKWINDYGIENYHFIYRVELDKKYLREKINDVKDEKEIEEKIKKEKQEKPEIMINKNGKVMKIRYFDESKDLEELFKRKDILENWFVLFPFLTRRYCKGKFIPGMKVLWERLKITIL